MSTGSTQRLLIVGNSGSGKSTLAKQLSAQHVLAHLDLDSIVWEPGKIAVQRAMADALGDLERFIAQHSGWVIEGCYSELIEAALPHCSQLLFLNSGLEACLANNRRRPWEPHKYASAAEQDRMLANLQAWVESYYQREDAWSYSAHRRLFDQFDGSKQELHELSPIASGTVTEQR